MEFSSVPESAKRHHHVMCVCQTDSEWASMNGMVICYVLHASKTCTCVLSVLAAVCMFCISGQLRMVHLLARKKNPNHISGTFPCRDLELYWPHFTKHTHMHTQNVWCRWGWGLWFFSRTVMHIGCSHVFLRGVLQPCNSFCPATLHSGEGWWHSWQGGERGVGVGIDKRRITGRRRTWHCYHFQVDSGIFLQSPTQFSQLQLHRNTHTHTHTLNASVLQADSPTPHLSSEILVNVYWPLHIIFQINTAF